MLGNVSDNLEDLRARIKEALNADIVALTGGVSVGKYDLVEQVLRELGAQFFFDSVAIRPGKPAVFLLLSEQAGVWTCREIRCRRW